MSVTLILGPMFAGKTSALHSHMAKAMLAGKPTLLLVPHIDTRYTRKALSTSHDGVGLQATRTAALLDVAVPTGVVGIEEAHFFEDLAPFLVQQIQQGNDVYVAGLHADSNRKPWPSISQAMALADHIEFKHASILLRQDRVGWRIERREFRPREVEFKQRDIGERLLPIPNRDKAQLQFEIGEQHCRQATANVKDVLRSQFVEDASDFVKINSSVFVRIIQVKEDVNVDTAADTSLSD